MKFKFRYGCQLLFAVALLGGAATTMASADYRVWYYDEFGNHDVGDLSDGNDNMNLPAWACGRRFFDPAYFRWVGDDEVTIEEGDFDENVHVWLPLGGDCPDNEIPDEDPLVQLGVLIEDQDGGEVYPAPVGRHYMEISTNYGGYWIDKDGGWPACNCSLPLGFKNLAANVKWVTLDRVIDDVKTKLATSTSSALALRLLDDARRRLLPLQRDLTTVVNERRRQSYGQIESSVRSLEDQAMAATARASSELASCRSQLLAGRRSDGYVICDVGAASARSAHRALKTVVDEVAH